MIVALACLSFVYLSAVTRPMAGRDSDLQKDLEDGEESPLCDPEEMDLLGEIFETLSSRSSHECGLLYGTRSLDLFALDSHDYITKVPYRKVLFLSEIQYDFIRRAVGVACEILIYIDGKRHTASSVV